MKHTVRRVMAVTTFAVLAGAIGGEARASPDNRPHRHDFHVPVLAGTDLRTLFRRPHVHHDVPPRRFRGTRDRATTRRGEVQSLQSRDSPEGLPCNWSISVTANYAENTTTVTGAYFNFNAISSSGPVIRDIGRTSSTGRSTTSPTRSALVKWRG